MISEERLAARERFWGRVNASTMQPFLTDDMESNARLWRFLYGCLSQGEVMQDLDSAEAEIDRLNAMIADALQLDPDGKPLAPHDVTCNSRNYPVGRACNCWQAKLGGGE